MSVYNLYRCTTQYAALLLLLLLYYTRCNTILYKTNPISDFYTAEVVCSGLAVLFLLEALLHSLGWALGRLIVLDTV